METIENVARNDFYRGRTGNLLAGWVDGAVDEIDSRKVYKDKTGENLMATVRQEFFARRADLVAQELLGRTLCIKGEDGKIVRGRLTEIAAYDGATKRTSSGALYQPGFVSISCKFGQYLIDIATGGEDKPDAKKDASCITIRGVSYGLPMSEPTLVKGPGNVSKHFGINSRTCELYEGATAFGRLFWISGQASSLGAIEWKKGNSDNCMGFYHI